MAVPTYQSSSSAFFGATGSNFTAAYPLGVVLGDLLVLRVVGKYPTNYPNVPSGWTFTDVVRCTSSTGAGVDNGDVYCWIASIVATAFEVSESAASAQLFGTFTGAVSTAVAGIDRLSPTAGKTISIASALAVQDTEVSAAHTLSFAPDLSWSTDDLAMIVLGGNTDSGGYAQSGGGLAITGSTHGLITEQAAAPTSMGDDCKMEMHRCAITSGGGSGPATYTITVGGVATSTAAILLRFREVDPPSGAPDVATWKEPERVAVQRLLQQRLPMHTMHRFDGSIPAPPYSSFGAPTSPVVLVGVRLRAGIVAAGAGVFTPPAVQPPVAEFIAGSIPGRYVLTGGGIYKPTEPPPPPTGEFVSAGLPGFYDLAGGLVAYGAQNYLGLSGVLAGQATVSMSASLLVDRHLAAVIAGASALSGAVMVDRRLAGASIGDAVYSGTLAVRSALSAAAAGLLEAAGALQVDRDLGGDVAGLADQAGLLFRGRALQGLIEGLSGLAGTLRVDRPLSGAIASSASFDAALRRFFAMAGGTIGASGSLADATLVRAAIMSGTIGGAAALAAALLTRDARLLGRVAGESGALARLALALELGGDVAGRSELTGFLRQIVLRVPPPYTRADGGGHAFASSGRGVQASLEGRVAGRVVVLEWRGRAVDSDEEDD